MPPKINPYEGVHIVVVDDDSKSRKITIDYLEKMGFRNIDLASDGEVGLANIAEETRLLIANIYMPNIHTPHMNGIELLRVIREVQSFKRETVCIKTSVRKNLKLILDARDSNRPFGTLRIIKKINKSEDQESLDLDDKKNASDWDVSGEWGETDDWEDSREDEEAERVVHIPDNLSVMMISKELKEDDLEKVLTFGGAEFIRKPLDADEFRFTVQKALINAEAEEGVRLKYKSWTKSLELSGRELIREFGMEKKSSSQVPFQERHSEPLSEFSVDQQKSVNVSPFLNANPNWTTDRSAKNISNRWKITFASLIAENFRYCRKIYAKEHYIKNSDKENKTEDKYGIGKMSTDELNDFFSNLQYKALDKIIDGLSKKALTKILNSGISTKVSDRILYRMSDKVLVCDLGLGSGKTLKGLRTKGIPEDSLVAVANTRLFELQSMLESALLPKIKHEEDSAVMNQFLKYFSVEFLNQKGRSGLLDIQLGKSEHETRLRKLLHEVDVNEICKNRTLLLPGMFNQEKEEVISNEVIKLFKKYRKNPRIFFKKYFEPELIDANKGSLQQLAKIHGKHLLPMDFRDIGERLDKSQIFGPIYDCRALSHLPDPGYYNTMLAVLARMTPGAIHIGDGAIQSYSQHIRGGELKQILDLYNENEDSPEYKAWWVGDDNGPLFSMVQRGVLNKRTNKYRFWKDKHLKTYLRNSKLIPFDQFYKEWSKVAFKNLIIRELRKRFWDESMKEMMSKKKSIEYVRTWLSDKMRIPFEHAKYLTGLKNPPEQGIWIHDYLDRFLNPVFEGKEFQNHIDADDATKLEKWMKRRKNGEKSGWIIELADEFMKLRNYLKQKSEETNCSINMEDTEDPEQEDESDDSGETKVSAAS